MYKILIIFSLFLGIVIFSGCQDIGMQQPQDNNTSSDYLVVLDNDECQNEYVIIKFNDKIITTDIKNYQTPDGSCIAKKILECLRESKNHGQFVSCMAHLTNSWKKAGIITNTEKGEIMVWAAQSDIP